MEQQQAINKLRNDEVGSQCRNHPWNPFNKLRIVARTRLQAV